MSHSFIFLISNTSRPSLHISHSPICEFYPLWVCHKGTSVLIPPLPPDYWHTSFIFLAGPGPLHEIAVSAFSRSPLGRANVFSFLFLLLTPRKYLSVRPPSPCFLVLIFPLFLQFLFILSCAPQVSLWTVVSLLGFLLYPPILSRQRYPTLIQLALLLLSPIQRYQGRSYRATIFSQIFLFFLNEKQ